MKSKSIEGQTKEFKDFSETSKENLKKHFWFVILKSICSFANAEGGEIQIGINDKSRKYSEQPEFIKNLFLEANKDLKNFDNKISEYLDKRIEYEIKSLLFTNEQEEFQEINIKEINNTENNIFFIIIIKPLENDEICYFKKEITTPEKKENKNTIYFGKTFKRIGGENKETNQREIEEIVRKKTVKNLLKEHLDPHNFTARQISIFLLEEIFHNSRNNENNFITENYKLYFFDIKDLEAYQKSFSYQFLESIYYISEENRKINWENLILRIKNIWQNNIFIANIASLSKKSNEYSKEKEIETIRFLIYSRKEEINKAFNEIINISYEEINLDLLFDISELLLKTIEYYIYPNISTFIDESLFLDMNNINITKIEKSIPFIIKALKEKLTIQKEDEFYIRKILISDLKKIFFNFWFFFNHQEKRSLKNVFEDSKKFERAFLNFSEEKQNILFKYFVLNHFLKQDFDPLSNSNRLRNNRNIYIRNHFLNITILEINKSYISNLKKINNSRTLFIEEIIIPLSNSLNLFDSKEENLIQKMIWSHLRIIVKNLDLTLFNIPKEFRKKEEFNNYCKNSFILNFVFKEAKLNSVSHSHSRKIFLLKEEDFELGFNFKEEIWIKEIIKILNSKLGKNTILNNKIKEKWKDITNLLLDKEVIESLDFLIWKK